MVFFHKLLGLTWYFLFYLIITPLLILKIGQSLDWLFFTHLFGVDLSFSNLGSLFDSVLIGSGIALLLAGALLVFQAFEILAREAIVFPFGVISSKHLGPEKLVKSGPYKFVRHPMLLGYLLALLGLGIFQKSPLTVFWVVPIFGWAALEYLMLTEEKMLSSWFGGEYEEYRNKIPALIPWKKIICVLH